MQAFGPARAIGAGQADEAEALWRLHLQEAEDYLLMNKSMTTVLDLLGRSHEYNELYIS